MDENNDWRSQEVDEEPKKPIVKPENNGLPTRGTGAYLYWSFLDLTLSSTLAPIFTFLDAKCYSKVSYKQNIWVCGRLAKPGDRCKPRN